MSTADNDIDALCDRFRAALLADPDLAPRADALARLAQPCINLAAQVLTVDDRAFIDAEYRAGRRVDHLQFRADRLRTNERDLPLGASRLGFVPDLPPDLPWPTHAGKRLQFLAQLDLAAMPRWPGSPLPPDGWFYVFILLPHQRSRDNPWRCAILHHRGPRDALARAPKPDPDTVWSDTRITTHKLLPLIPLLDLSLDAVAAAKEAGVSLPDFYTLLDVLEEHLPPTPDPSLGELSHAGHLLGHTPDWVEQSPSEIVRDLARRGVDATAGSLPNPQHPGDDWIPLLTLASAGTMQWSDAGQLHLLIRPTDLAAADFSRVCMTICSS